MHPMYITQALSKSVADGFAYFGDEATTETQIFVRNFYVSSIVLMSEAFLSGIQSEKRT